MQKTDLYRYHGEGGVVDTLVLLPAPYELRKRIAADEGMLLTDGETTAKVIDIPVEDIERWTEIPEPELTEGGEQ